MSLTLEPGAPVYEVARRRWHPDYYKLSKIERLTKTQIVCDSGNRYSRLTLIRVGQAGRLADPSDPRTQQEAARAAEEHARTFACNRAWEAFEKLRKNSEALTAADWFSVAEHLESTLKLARIDPSKT